MVAIATKDPSKLSPKIKEALPELIQIVVGCITEDKKVVEEEPELKMDKELYCSNHCWIATEKRYSPALLACISNCWKEFQV